MTWTDSQINEYSVYLDRQEQLVLQALDLGYKTIDEIELYVKQNLGDCDHDYVEMVYNVQTNPGRKVPLEIL